MLLTKKKKRRKKKKKKDYKCKNGTSSATCAMSIKIMKYGSEDFYFSHYFCFLVVVKLVRVHFHMTGNRGLCHECKECKICVHSMVQGSHWYKL